MGLERKEVKGVEMILKLLVCLIRGHKWHIKQVIITGKDGLEVRYVRVCSRCTWDMAIPYDWEIEAYNRKDKI